MLRTSLGSISSNRRSHTQYSSYQRGLIHEAVAAGVTSYRIEKFYEIAQFTIIKKLKKLNICIDDCLMLLI